MCTFDISLDNEVVDRIIVVEEQKVPKKHSLSNLIGIVKGDFDINAIREEYIREKFGI